MVPHNRIKYNSHSSADCCGCSGLWALRLDGDALDLHEGVLGQGGHLIGGAGGERLSEELGVDGVHGGKITDVFQHDGGLDHIVHGRAGGGQNVFDVGQGLAGLAGDVLPGKGAGGGVDGQLAGDKQGAARLNALGVGTDGGGGVGGGNRVVHGKNSFLVIGQHTARRWRQSARRFRRPACR